MFSLDKALSKCSQMVVAAKETIFRYTEIYCASLWGRIVDCFREFRGVCIFHHNIYLSWGHQWSTSSICCYSKWQWLLYLHSSFLQVSLMILPSNDWFMLFLVFLKLIYRFLFNQSIWFTLIFFYKNKLEEQKS